MHVSHDLDGPDAALTTPVIKVTMEYDGAGCPSNRRILKSFQSVDTTSAITLHWFEWHSSSASVLEMPPTSDVAYIAKAGLTSVELWKADD